MNERKPCLICGRPTHGRTIHEKWKAWQPMCEFHMNKNASLMIEGAIDEIFLQIAAMDIGAKWFVIQEAWRRLHKEATEIT